MVRLCLTQSPGNLKIVFVIHIKLKKLVVALWRAIKLIVSTLKNIPYKPHIPLRSLPHFISKDLTVFRSKLEMPNTMVIISKLASTITNSFIKENQMKPLSEKDANCQISHFYSLVEKIGSQTKILPLNRKLFQFIFPCCHLYL